MNRCPRGCRPTPLAGYIDEHPLDTAGFLHVWIRPDGEDELCKPDHAICAMRELKRLGHRATEDDAVNDLMAQGWIRISGYLGSISVEMRTAPTLEQTSTLDRYLRTPGILFRGAAIFPVGGRSRYLDSDGFTRMTGGRIAAWARG